ncbi:alpha/beta hydrolase-fold protein [Crocosphaera sp.]|uniref:alpha/beta hydrolase n=1 Tax=Crocosphaera sp. TaxID=2729996 RepID=UPI00261804A2|nr:alpha/beta hydrolase-fold protein [Crocosphaera sp.]MDJ0582445.1 alpha/beta hydrolase-fold protein [Crocosphaera sp.]
MAEPFRIGGQNGWYHDQGHWAGYFHTYNDFKVDHTDSEPRTIHVFLPRDYEYSHELYPVIYMNDGDTAFFSGGEYDKSWNMGEILSRLYVTNQIRRVIVVAICPLDRNYEYTHAPIKKGKWGGLEVYSDYLSTAVKGFIDDNYRTLSNPENTMILGSSHGGLAAFYTAIKHPDKFRCVAALSPSFWVGLDSIIDPCFLESSRDLLGSLEYSALIVAGLKTLQNSQLQPKIYLDWGLIREGGEHNFFIEARATVRGREMRDLLINKFGYRYGENLFVVEDPIGQHNEESWSGRMENVLQNFFGWPALMKQLLEQQQAVTSSHANC